ncbi:MAG: polysaccharide deacetylase family protein [Lachnospiraceae bacterium]|nr:polysaccharide deacetylase family protein [Lachnospiraceae bacterium]
MKKKLLVTACFAAVCAFLGVLIYSKSDSDSKQSINSIDSLQTISYDASTEYEEALKKFESGCENAKVIRDDDSANNSIALVFEGTSDTVIIEKIISLLDEHDVKATFALSAMEAAEDEKTLQLIAQKGHDIANAGLRGESSMEEMSDEELIYDFTYSKKVFTTLLNKDTELLMLDRTLYTDLLCCAAAASGFDRLIAASAGHYLNETSFKEYEKASNYISKQPGGTIIVIKLDGYLDALEIEPKVEVKKPAEDKKASTDITKEEEERSNEDIVKVVEWILKAIDENSKETVLASSLKSMTNEEYVKELFDNEDQVKARMYRDVNTIENIVGLTFKGMVKDEETLDRLLATLEKNNAKATFFVSRKDIEDNKDLIVKIAEAGHAFGTLGTDARDLSQLDRYTIYEDLINGERAIRSTVSLKCRYYMPAGDASDELLIAAGVAGLTVIVAPDRLSTQKGSISLLNLSDDYDVSALDRYLSKAGSENIEVADLTELIRQAETIPVIDQQVIDELRDANEGKLASDNSFIYTTEKATVMCFFGVSNKPVVRDVLNVLDERGYQGTFFVTADEMKNCGEQIEEIINAGHEVGIAYIENNKYPASFDSVAAYILGSMQFLEWKYGISTTLVEQPYGEVADETKEAVSATGCTLVGHEFSMVQSQYTESRQVSEFYGKYSGKIHVHRGSIAYFSMNSFSADRELDEESDEATLLGDLLRTYISRNIDTLVYKDYKGVYQQSTRYNVRSYSSVANTKYCYVPGRGGNKAVSLNNSYLGNLQDRQEQNAYIFARYIGNPSVTRIPGFSDEECEGMDKKGYITDDRTIFLTFDDWGNDSDVNQLLYVLNKYGVSATFFIRTNNVSSNPNLLRAIAGEGHAIASHTHSHMQLSVPDTSVTDGYEYLELSDEQAQVLRRDLVTSYDVLNRYTGDMVVNGKKALTTLFRSPTLAAGRNGMYQVFDTGFTYMVSGSLSTQDYKAASVDELVNVLRNGREEFWGMNRVGNGTCIVMHMSPDAVYTAEALDIMIPEWQSQGYTFNRLDDYLK